MIRDSRIANQVLKQKVSSKKILLYLLVYQIKNLLICNSRITN